MAHESIATKLSTWRGSNQGGTGHNGLLSKLSIDGALYDIKDPAVEQLATWVDSELTTLENKTVRSSDLIKAEGSGKFATSVTQTQDGQVTVTYDNIRATALSDTAVTGQFVTSVSQGTDGQISLTRSGVSAANVTFDPTSTDFESTSTDVQAALVDALTQALALKGTNSDDKDDDTIAGAKAYADYVVNQLAGQDWTTAAQTVQDIIDELGGDNAGWATLVDKLQGMGWSATGTEGQPGYVAGNSNPTVVEYVQHKIAEVNAANAEGIADLDAVVYGAGSNGTSATTDASTAATSFTNDTSNKVVVKVTEVDGKITGVDVKTNDIASAADLQTLDGAAVKSVNGQTPTNGAVTVTAAQIDLSSSDSTKVGTAISNLDSNKANKAAITTATIKNWSSSYASEQLTWTSTDTSVYVPATGQTL